MTPSLLSLLRLLWLSTAVFLQTSAQEEEPLFSFPRDLTSLDDVAILSDGNEMPVVGLGVALTGEKTAAAVKYALSINYKLVDTASHESYGNEDQVGTAVREYESDHPSEHIFVITKIWDADKGFYRTLQSFDASYDALNDLYEHPESNNSRPIDMYMIHSPFRGKIVETWDAMLLAQKKGYAVSLGVSNFGIPHLEAIRNSQRPMPTVNQIEMHPLVYKYRLPLIQYCQKHHIHIQAYGSLLHGYDEFLKNETCVLSHVAKKYPAKTKAQILLRWALQHEFLVIPKSSNPARILENAQLLDFALAPEDMTALDDWGDEFTDEQRNIYEEDWGWNPIDEATKVGLGRTDYWPDYKGVRWDEEEDGHEEL
jgi:diketogulonate reductase-like aldo/keto reductase